MSLRPTLDSWLFGAPSVTYEPLLSAEKGAVFGGALAVASFRLPRKQKHESVVRLHGVSSAPEASRHCWAL